MTKPVTTPEDANRDLVGAYRATFGSIAGQEVLKDLSRFCRGRESTFDPDPRLHALLEGRREVLLRILRATGAEGELTTIGGPSR